MPRYAVSLGNRQFMEFGNRYGPGTVVVKNTPLHKAEEILKRLRQVYKETTRTDLRFQEIEEPEEEEETEEEPATPTQEETIGSLLREPEEYLRERVRQAGVEDADEMTVQQLAETIAFQNLPELRTSEEDEEEEIEEEQAPQTSGRSRRR